MSPLFSVNVPLARVFYNIGDFADKAWSVDFGPHTPEIITGHVYTRGVDAETDFIPIVPDKKEYPRAWFVVRDCLVEVYQDHIDLKPAVPSV